jgi:GT2 family glycosyltransferase
VAGWLPQPLVSGEEAFLVSVAIVIPVWNRRELLLRLLEKLRAQTHPINEVIAVDNGSTDGAADAAEREGARVIRLGANLGFARAVNEGIEASRADLVALVNSDVEPEADWLARLAAALEASGAWFATGKILSAREPGVIDGTFDLVSRGGCAWRAGQGRPDSAEFRQPRAIDIAPATAVLYRRQLFDRVGLFDPAFESYLEDVDLGIRCAVAGLGGVYAPDAVARHWGSASLGAWNPRTVRLIARNQVLLARKHCSRRDWRHVVAGQILWGLLAVRHGAGFAFLKGKIAGLRAARSVASCRTAPQILQRSEDEIKLIQGRNGCDRYWTVYFLLTSGGAD